MKSTPVIACLFFLVAWNASSDPLIAHAQQREKAGDLEGSAALLSSWLGTYPGASGSAAVFAMYMRVEQELPALLAVAGRFLQSGKGLPGAAQQFEKIARLFDVSGRIEEARDAYLAAHAEGATDATLVSAFLLSLQMNDSDSMAFILRRLAAGEDGSNSTGGATHLFLRALSNLHSGNRPAARETLIGLADQTGNPELALKALWVLYQTAGSDGDAAGQAAARAKLGSRFSSAPEAALAAPPSVGPQSGRTVVIPLPTPLQLQAGGGGGNLSLPPSTLAASPTPPDPTSPLIDSASPRFSVQVGSFLMKENADDLLSELKRRGFSPVVVHETAQEKDRFRVLAGTGLQSDAARALLKKLSEEGFKGFLVAEK